MNTSEYVELRKKSLAARDAFEDFQKKVDKEVSEAIKVLKVEVSHLSSKIIQTETDIRTKHYDSAEFKALNENYYKLREDLNDVYFDFTINCKHKYDDGTTTLIEVPSRLNTHYSYIECVICSKTWHNDYGQGKI